MAQYLLVRDSDGAILAELGSAGRAIRMLDALGDIPSRGLSLVRVEDSPGEVVGSNSIISMRPAGFDQVIRAAEQERETARAREKMAPRKGIRRA